MRIFAIGDLHNDLGQAIKLAKRAVIERVDLVLFSGDITFAERLSPGVIKVFKDSGLRIALIPGNHESPATAEALAQKYGAFNLHGYYIKFGDVGIFGCGSANIGIFQLPEDHMFSLLKRSADSLKDVKRKVMVTHAHPEGTIISKLAPFPASTGIRRAIDEIKPDILICSHVHETEGLEVSINNTIVHSVGKEGKLIEI